MRTPLAASLSPSTLGALPRRAWAKFAFVGWGTVAQACSAVTNLGLVVIGGNVLGPAGLGSILAGFAAYLLVLGFVRNLLTTPLIVRSAATDDPSRRWATRQAFMLVFVASVACACAFAVVGIVVRTHVGTGLIFMAPWLVPALVQDLGRSVVFRDLSGPRTILSDLVWLIGMIIAIPLTLKAGTAWAVTACWGLGALAGAVFVLAQLQVRPVRIGNAARWWLNEAWPFGRWLFVGAVSYSLLSYATVVALLWLIGTDGFGGIRAVQSLFAPLTLLGPAITLAGLPFVARTITRDPSVAARSCALLAGLVTGATVLYLVVAYYSGLLSLVFGSDFASFGSIVVPIGLSQLIAAPASGIILYLTAAQRGRAVTAASTLNAALLLAFSFVLARLFGTNGAAWATVVAAGIWLVTLAGIYALPVYRSVRRSPGPAL